MGPLGVIRWEVPPHPLAPRLCPCYSRVSPPCWPGQLRPQQPPVYQRTFSCPFANRREMDPGDDGPPDDHGSTCPVCGRDFASLIGRRIHERQVHHTSFHAEGAARLAARPKSRWDPEEVHLMAEFKEAHPNITFISQAIQREVLPHRTIEGIKGKRRPAEYKAMVLAVIIRLHSIPATLERGSAPWRPAL